MPGFFDFIKKNPSDASGTVPAGQNPAPGTPQPQQVSVTQTTQQSGPATQSYNGIGAPAGGQSYNGIGAPPSGQSYNGIGAPPVAPAPVTETTTVQVQPAPAAAQAPAPINAAAAPAPAAPGVSEAAPADPNAPKDTNVAVAPADANTSATTPNGTATDPSAQDPNAPKDAPAATEPNGAKDSNAPVDPNAPKDPNLLSEAELAAYKNPDGTPKLGPDGKPLDPKTQNPDGTPKLGPDGKPLAADAAAGDKNPDGTPKLGPDGKPLDPNAADPTQQKRNDMDVMTHLTQRSNRVFLSANNKAKELNATEMDSEHLLHGLLTDPEIYKLLVGMKIQPQMIDQELDKVYKKSDKAPTTPVQVSPRVKRILDSSLVIARKLGYEFISPEHLLVASYDEGEGIAAQTLKKLNVNKEELNKKILGKKEGLDEKDSSGKMQKSALAQFTIDLTAKAEAGKLDPCVGRSDVIERVTHILSRRLKNNPVLTGEPGVGKTAVVEGLAQQIVAKQVPEQLLGKRILQLDLMSVIAGASHRGEFEERMKNLVSEVQEGKGSIILFIDEIHTIVGAGGGGEGSLDASNFIKPALSRGELQMIGATTITEYKRIEKDAALERRFQPVLVPEPTEEQAIKMLKSLRDKFEGFHRVKIPDDAIEQAVKLSKRYIGDRFLPDKAVDLIDESASAVRLPLMSLPEEIKNVEERIAQIKQEKDEADKRGDRVKVRILNSKLDDITADLNKKKDEYNVKKAQTTTVVTLDIIKDIISKKTGIPVNKLTGTEKDKLSKLEEIMHQRLIGQERPVKSVSEAVRRGRAGLKSNARPIGSFVFLGPSGVGKTELAKTLADILFGQEEAMIRFDMTEYMEKHEVAKLLGPPPGYVGYEEGGKLTEAVRQRQYAVVLFDEVEKAHPDIFNILLQILDDGRLTDNKGRTISFKNTVVICTSNIGTKLIQEELLKQNKGQVEEPPVVSTYTFSPRGREILTIGTKYFERDGSKAPSLETKPEEKKDPNAKDAQGQNKDGKKPEEKKDETKKGWNEGILFDYFAGQKIEKMQAAAVPAEDVATPAPAPQPQANAETDDAQFPVMGYDTHAISSKGVETISRDSLLFFKNSTTAKIWNVSTLIDYFKDGVVINALPDAPDEQLPTARLKTHAFSPDEKEIVTFRDRFWRRKEGMNDWETGYLKDYFVDQTIKEGSFPNTHWDIHTFSPTGKEVIVVGETIWSREQSATEWKQQTLKEYFGEDFPLEKEIDEKNKIETESEAKKYDVIKEKVMNELLKFFRPELVNRFDEVIVFEPLKFIHMIAIVKLQLKALTKLLEEQNLGFQATDSAVKEIVRGGFDPVFGARPLRRAIQRMVENPISEMIIAEKVHSGDFIYVDFDGEKLVFDIERTEMVTDGTKEPKNFTPLDVRAFVAKFFANDKDTIMKDLIAKWPEYGQEPKKEGEAKDGESKDGTGKEGEAKEGESADGKEKKPEVHDALIEGAKEAASQSAAPEAGNNPGSDAVKPADGAALAGDDAKPADPNAQAQSVTPGQPVAPASKEEAELQNMLQNLSMEAVANPDPGVPAAGSAPGAPANGAPVSVAPTGSVANGAPNGSPNGTMQMNGKPPGNPQGSMPQALSA